MMPILNPFSSTFKLVSIHMMKKCLRCDGAPVGRQRNFVYRPPHHPTVYCHVAANDVKTIDMVTFLRLPRRLFVLSKVIIIVPIRLAMPSFGSINFHHI
mmetsp:Transcript_52398/g.52783  ORF Transcript_52398/g.52783 Transcript_52398/m.52783 type:complete len:99 (-) Transcript_52398:147-443(-)